MNPYCSQFSECRHWDEREGRCMVRARITELDGFCENFYPREEDMSLFSSAILFDTNDDPEDMSEIEERYLGCEPEFPPLDLFDHLPFVEADVLIGS